MRVFIAFLRGFASGLWGVVRDHPWQAALVAALALAWLQHGGKRDALADRDTARAALGKAQDAHKADRAAWAQQVATARAATAAAERKSQETATDAQKNHDTLAADNAGLRAYIADRRLRLGSGAAPAARPADDLGAAVSDPATASTLVAADEADLVSCDGAYVYAAAAHEWARGLISADLARPAP